MEEEVEVVSSARIQVRVKATAKYTATGWRGILIIDRDGDRAKKRGPSRTSLAEAEADAQAMLQDFQRSMGK
ncbi:MAG TPA: hypothetical protein VE954_43175 [Oligoflexus sp.]|uniref:hypothetical protein n=1 Tax=Oligoflexus sp. TaxID=1971216 RepID=UPI002D44FF91|nr:hypothetical protein [Oligoflexus sp.]HYX39947.1 hypothetical protein [Oligoflexus sp.]